MQAAIHFRNHEMVLALLQRGGMDLSNPPDFVPPITDHLEVHTEYRRSPFIIQAACYGDKVIMEILIATGCSLYEIGHIALSKRHRNSLTHNVIGAAAYHGNSEVLAYCLHFLSADHIDLRGQEMPENLSNKLKPELNDFTPL